MAGFAVFLCLLFSLLPLVSPEAVYYITPTPETSCHHTDCYTLSEVLGDTDRYFDASTKLVFLPGKHTLDTGAVFLENLGSVVWQGNSESLPKLISTVECSQSSGVVFVNVSKVEMNALTFSSCGDRNTIMTDVTVTYLPTITAMFIPLFQVHSCVMQYSHLPLFLFESILDCHDCSFKHNQGENGGAILAFNSTVKLLGQTVVHGNHASREGGAVYAENSVLVVRGIAYFTDNLAPNTGGAISAHISHICFQMYLMDRQVGYRENEYWFVDNLSTHGGGLALEQCTMTTSHGVKLYFTGNFANGYGGGLWSAGSTMIISSYIAFQDNTALLGGGNYLKNSSWASASLFSVRNIAASGGGTYSHKSTLQFEKNSYFANNSLKVPWGFIYEFEDDVTVPIYEYDMDLGNGGGLFTSESNATFYKAVTFFNNTGYNGGALFSQYSDIQFVSCENTEYNYSGISNGFDTSCILCLFNNTSYGESTDFVHNFAVYYGGAIDAYSSTINFWRPTTFVHNFAKNGGAIHVFVYSVLHFKVQNIFIENSANYGGGVSCGQNSIVIFNGSGNMFSGNRAEYSGGWIDIVTYSTLRFVGNGCFVNNSASRLGGAISASESAFALTGNFSFINSSAFYGGAVYVDESEITLDGMHTFTGNAAEDQVFGGYGGGLYARASRLTFIGQQRFIKNSANYGGAMAITQTEPSKPLYLTANTTVYFFSNYAWHKGGAVMVQDTSSRYCPYDPQNIRYKMPYCFIQLEGNLVSSSCKRVNNKMRDSLTDIIFDNNLSERGGDILYGGDLEACIVCCSTFSPSYLGSNVFSYLTGVPLKQYSGKPLISSDPNRICICNNSEPNCSVMSLNYSLYPGETLYITVAAVGQLNGTVSAVIRAQLENAKVDKFQTTQQVNKTCSTLQYRIKKGMSVRLGEVVLNFYVEGSCQTLGNDISVYITLLPCPLGFFLSPSGECICEKRLQKFTSTCDIANRSISRTGDFWVGYDKESYGLILHPHCPFDYCRLEAVSFTLNSTDVQCAHSRSGVLCGSCKPGLSLNLGSSRCSDCSNSHVFIFFITALAGFLLVIFIFIFRVSVTDGTTSGLIFYANVILVNRNLFYPSTTTNVLTVVIAWLNLDLGIETCLFHGMDAYIRTWLQFVFPLYIWILVGIITLASHYSMTVAKVIGPTNPVSVLATLFLLSYTKLLRTIIATLAFTTLEYPNDKSVVVWRYDGNIPYLGGKHIPLFIAGMLSSIFLFLPYTLLLLFGQCMLAASNHRLVSWATNPKVRFFLDTYHAPYKNRHRYWVGLLLLLRFIVFIISVTVDINAPRDPSTNLLVLIITCAGIQIWTTSTGGVYKKIYNTILESSFILNLTILAAVSYQVKVEGGRKEIAAYLSMTVAFVTFLGIITYHVSQQLVKARIWRYSIKPALHQLRLQLFRHYHHEEDPPVELTTPPAAQPRPVPTTFIELRESLLESQQ